MMKLKLTKYIPLLISGIIVLLVIALGYLSGINPALCTGITIAALSIIALFFIFFKNGKLSIESAVIPLLVVSILAPSIPISDNFPALRLELILIIVAWVLLILGHFAIGTPLKLRWNPTNKWFLIFGIAMFISIASASLIHNYYPVARDFWEFGKLIEYFLIFVLVSSLRIPPERMQKYYIAALIIFLCATAFGFAQYFNLFDINSWLSPYYYESAKYGVLDGRWFLSTSGNPNNFGALMILAASISLAGALWLKGKGIKLSSWISFGVFSLAIIFTFSRSALLCLLVATLFLLFFRYPIHFGFGRTVRMLLFIIPLFLIGVLIAFQFTPESFFMRMGSALNSTTDTSWQARLITWQGEFDIWKQAPIFGWGPGKATMIISVDNEWLLLLRRYGVIGVSVFILWFIGIYRNLTKIAIHCHNNYTESLCAALEATIIAYAVFMIPAGIYHNLQLMPVLLIFLGLAYTQRKSSQTERET
jgi:O-antigen ligase